MSRRDSSSSKSQDTDEHAPGLDESGSKVRYSGKYEESKLWTRRRSVAVSKQLLRNQGLANLLTKNYRHKSPDVKEKSESDDSSWVSFIESEGS